MTIEQAREIGKDYRDARHAILLLNDCLCKAGWSDGRAINAALETLGGIPGVHQAEGYLDGHEAGQKEKTS